MIPPPSIRPKGYDTLQALKGVISNLETQYSTYSPTHIISIAQEISRHAGAISRLSSGDFRSPDDYTTLWDKMLSDFFRFVPDSFEYVSQSGRCFPAFRLPEQTLDNTYENPYGPPVWIPPVTVVIDTDLLPIPGSASGVFDPGVCKFLHPPELPALSCMEYFHPHIKSGFDCTKLGTAIWGTLCFGHGVHPALRATNKWDLVSLFDIVEACYGNYNIDSPYRRIGAFTPLHEWANTWTGQSPALDLKNLNVRRSWRAMEYVNVRDNAPPPVRDGVLGKRLTALKSRRLRIGGYIHSGLTSLRHHLQSSIDLSRHRPINHLQSFHPANLTITSNGVF
jgi:hypothetical protein